MKTPEQWAKHFGYPHTDSIEPCFQKISGADFVKIAKTIQKDATQKITKSSWAGIIMERCLANKRKRSGF